MSFDYQAAKAAISDAGHKVSAGEQILAADIFEIVKFGRRKFGLTENAVRRGIANPALLPEGFPGTAAAPVAEAAPAPEAAPVIPEAPAQESAPAEDATKGKKSKKAAESAPAEAPAQDAPATDATAQDAPADGEQAAQ